MEISVIVTMHNIKPVLATDNLSPTTFTHRIGGLSEFSDSLLVDNPFTEFTLSPPFQKIQPRVSHTLPATCAMHLIQFLIGAQL